MTQDIADYGLRQANTTSASYIYTKARAVKVAETLARKAQYERNKYTFKLDWAFCRLEVGDLVTLTDESCGLNKQPAMIDSVTEGTDGLLTITAISRAKGDYSAASFDVHAVDRPYVDYNVAPPDTDAPIILQPPAELTTSGLEVWIGARGKRDGWGGCRVYVSDNKDYYRYAGQIATAARIGTLASAVTADATSIEIDANGDFLSGTQQDAERGNTLCWLGGECLSYQTATLLQNGHYELTGCIRGQYQTTAAKHDAGAEFARLDTALLRIPFLKEDIGKKVYLKLASYNIFGNNEQDLSNLDEYEYTILPYYIPPVRNLRAHNRYRQLVDGVSRYDLEVEWEPPEDMTSYLEGQVWYKTDHEQGDRLVIKEGVPADELGYQHDWTFAGSGQNRATIPQAIVGDTYRIAVTTKDRWGAMTSPDQAPRIEILVAVKSEIPNTPENFGITFGNKAELYWDEVTNSDIAYYEVRTDQSAGLGTASLVVRTSSLKASVTLAERTGTLYLYACNAQGKYSYPAVLTYKKTRPDAPTNITITTALRGANFRVPPIPSTATNVRYYISGAKTTDMIESKNPLVVYQCEPDVYSIYACYVDIFGEGYRTVDYAFTITPYIDPEWLKDEAISLKKVDKTIQSAVSDAQQAIPRLDTLDANVTELKKTDGEIVATVAANKKASDDADASLATQIKQTAESITSTVEANRKAQDKKNGSLDTDISQLKQTAESITSTVQANKRTSDEADASLATQMKQTAESITTVVSNLSDVDKAKAVYSAIAQLADAIQLRVTANDLEGLGKNGKLMSYLNMTPTSVSILSKLLHITADTLIDGNVITNGMIKAGAITADKLAASIIELTDSQGIKGGGATLDTNGLTVRGSDGSYVVHGSNGMEFHDGNGNTFAMVGAMIMGTVKDGQWVKFTKPWKTVPNVIVTPISLQTAIPGYNSTNLFLDCRPQNVTVNGFQAICRTVLKAGSGGVVPVNKSANKRFHDFRRKAFRDLTSYTYDISEIKVPDKATKVTVNSSWALENIGDIVWRSDDEDDYYDYLFGDIFVDMRIDVNGSTVKTKRLGSSYGQKTEKPFYENKSGNDSEVITVNGGDTIKIYGIISVQTVKRGDFNPQYGDSYDDFGDGSASYTLTNYTFNTTADAPLASGNAFFLCTNKHNSPYTISDS